MSRSKVRGQGHEGQKWHACGLMFGKTSLASRFNCGSFNRETAIHPARLFVCMIRPGLTGKASAAAGGGLL